MTKVTMIEDVQKTLDDFDWEKAPSAGTYTLETLPERLSDILTDSYVIANRDEYRAARFSNTEGTTKSGSSMASLFSMMPKDTNNEPKVKAEITIQKVILAIDDYEEQGYTANDAIDSGLFSYIIPRSQKAREIQRRRVKEKAEVFTPTYLCNKQNNLADDTLLYPGAFTVESSEAEKIPEYQKVKDAIGNSKTFDYIPSERIDFTNTDLSPEQYVSLKTLEATCGEGPYLFSRYDTVTGEYIPVQDTVLKRYWRIGRLDRKLRVISENFADKQTWVAQAVKAYQRTYGYEWQGDNLMLARLNAFNTFLEYYYNQFSVVDVEESVLETIATIISQNLFQMDGMKHIVPLSERTQKKKTATKTLVQKYTGHDGVLPVITWHDKIWFPYEDIVRDGLKRRGKRNTSK